MRELGDVRSTMPADVVIGQQHARMRRHGIRPAPLDITVTTGDSVDAERERLLRRDVVLHAISVSRMRRRRRVVELA